MVRAYSTVNSGGRVEGPYLRDERGQFWLPSMGPNLVVSTSWGGLGDPTDKYLFVSIESRFSRYQKPRIEISAKPNRMRRLIYDISSDTCTQDERRRLGIPHRLWAFISINPRDRQLRFDLEGFPDNRVTVTIDPVYKGIKLLEIRNAQLVE